LVIGEQDNILAALEWALGGAAVAIGARLAAAMGQIWDLRLLHNLQAHWARRARLHQEVLPPDLNARILAVLARAEGIRNNMEQSRQLGLEALATFRASGNDYMVGRTLVSLALSTVGAPSEYAQAKTWQAEALAIARKGGHATLESYCLAMLGEVARSAGDYVTARAAYEDCFRHAAGIGDPVMESVSLFNLSLVHAHEQDYDHALDTGRRAVQGTAEQHNDGATAYFLTSVAGAMGGLGQPERAARLYGASEALLQTMGARLEPIDLAECERGREVARAQIGSEKFDALLAEGKALTLEQAIELAMGGF
jgi:non-specific serine/threonine protein kinase